MMIWQDTGAVKLLAGLKVAGLRAPFKGAASVQDMTVNPDINTRVEDVGIKFGFQVKYSFRQGHLTGMCQAPSPRPGNTRTP